MWKYIGYGVLGLIAILALSWVAMGNDFFLYKFFAPKREEVRREVFEQTKSYNQGMIQEIQNFQFEYIKATPEQQKGLAAIILHRAADYDVNQLPPDLRSFIEKLRTERSKSWEK